VWTDGNRVAVADSRNNRVLIWNTFPTTNGQPADLVIGQAGFGTGTTPTIPTASSIAFPVDVYSDGVRLIVADFGNRRVLIWNSFPATNGQPADIVVGQATFETKDTGTSATAMGGPAGVVAVANSLLVSDPDNNRILVYSPIPTTSGAAAKLVLGQPSLTTNTGGVSQNAFRRPARLAVHGHELYVADQGNHRVLRFCLAL
jgi:hypothetical protein